MDLYIKRKILKKKGRSFEETEDYIAVEKKLRVFSNEKEIISLHCTPSMIKELIIGFFLTEGILTEKISPDDINVEDNDEIRVIITAKTESLMDRITFSRFLGGYAFSKAKSFTNIEDDFSLSTDDLKNIFQKFQQKSELFRLTGCFHSSALSDNKKILVFAEDIGRHNAVDKVIGYSILADISFRGKLIVVSCRISSEIVSKCARWGIPIIASRAAPTDFAIEIAQKTGVTLVGFVRGDSLNVYTHEQRIIN